MRSRKKKIHTLHRNKTPNYSELEEEVCDQQKGQFINSKLIRTVQAAKNKTYAVLTCFMLG